MWTRSLGKTEIVIFDVVVKSVYTGIPQNFSIEAINYYLIIMRLIFTPNL